MNKACIGVKYCACDTFCMQQIGLVEGIVGRDVPLWGADQVPACSGGPVVVILPALGVPASFYAPFVTALTARGVNTVVFDLPGQSSSGPRVDRSLNYGYVDTAVQVIRPVLSRVREIYAPTSVLLLGHSMGGQLATTYLGCVDDSDQPDGVSFIASGSPHWKAYRGRALASVIVGSQSAAAISRLVGYMPGGVPLLGSRHPQRFMADWAAFARSGRLSRIASPPNGFDQALHAAQLPVLAVDIANDWLTPPSSMDSLLRQIPNADLHRVAFDRGYGRRLDHFSWVRDPAGLDDVVVRWVRDVDSRVSAAAH